MNNFKFKEAPITYTLIGICILVYGITTVLYGFDMSSYDALLFGGFCPVYFLTCWNFLSIIISNFIHFGMMHIFCNCVSLYNIGIFVEKVLGKSKYLILMIVTGICTPLGSLIIYLITGQGGYTVSGGISGMIFGIIGSLCAMKFLYHGYFDDIVQSILPSLLMMLLISFMVPSISLVGHVSGLISGFAVTVIFEKIKPKYYIYH